MSRLPKGRIREDEPMRSATLVGLAFVASRLIYRGFVGISLDASPVFYFLQFLDPYFLETDLTRSVLALHHQAPLLNLLVGLCLKLFGGYAFVAVDVVFIALGLGAALSMANVIERLSGSRRTAVIGASLYACAPVTVLYESWLFYPHVVAALLLIASNQLLCFVETRSPRRGVAFFAVLALVGLVRSTYGPLWLCAVLGALLVAAPVPRWTLMKAASLPLALLFLHGIKTPLYVGHGYGDAMLWPNLAKKVHMHLPPREARRHIDDGHLTPAMKYEAFSDPRSMTEVRVPHEPTGIPALDDLQAPSGRMNANALEHVLIAERYYKQDAVFLLRTYPGVYAKASLRALFLGMPGSPTQDATLVKSPNYPRLASTDRALKRAVLTDKDGFSPVIAALLVFGLGAGALRLAGWPRRESGPRLGRAFAVFALVTILYTMTVTALVSWGDFPRYRYEVDGLLWILVALGAHGVFRATLSRLRHGRLRLDASVRDRAGSDQRKGAAGREEGDRPT